MAIRKFKPGDWVKLKGSDTAPKMEIIKYITKKDAIIGSVNKDIYVACVYYTNGKRCTKTAHQDRLVKLREVGGFYKP